MEIQLSSSEVDILKWFVTLIGDKKGLNINKLHASCEKFPLQKDSSSGMWYLEKDAHKFYMLKYDHLQEDFRYFYLKQQRNFATMLNHLCGIGSSHGGPVEGRKYPLERFIMYCRFGKKTFYAINQDVLDYLEDKDTSAPSQDIKEETVDLLDNKVALSEKFTKFYQSALAIYPFTHRLPKSDEAPTGTILACQKYFHQILSGDFFTANILENDEKIAPLDRKDITPETILLVLTNWCKYMKEKNHTKLSLEHFFYNPKQKFSYFISTYSRMKQGSSTDVPSEPMFIPKGFEEWWNMLVQQSSYLEIEKDVLVKNSFIMLYNELQKRRKGLDFMNDSPNFLTGMILPSLIEHLAYKPLLTKYDFFIGGHTFTAFKRKFLRNYAFDYTEEQFQHKTMLRNMDKASEKKSKEAQYYIEMEEAIRRGEVDDGIIVEDELYLTKTAKERKRVEMLADIECTMIDDGYGVYHANDSYEQVEKKWKEVFKKPCITPKEDVSCVVEGD
jgi:hypothetical protein